MKLETTRRIRMMALVTEVFGIVASIPQAFWIGILVWLWTYLHSVALLEDKFLQEPPNEEENDKEDKSS